MASEFTLYKADQMEESEGILQISQNYYEDMDLAEVAVDELCPLEALTIRDGAKYCYLHHTPLDLKLIKYRQNGKTYGIEAFVCRQCNRLFVKESMLESLHAALTERGIQHTLYDMALTNSYLRSQMTVHVMEKDEAVYVPDTWIEEKPVCPVHDAKLSEYPCKINYKDRTVSFSGYYCDECQKILMRRAAAYDLENKCAMVGVPPIRFEKIMKEVPVKRLIRKREFPVDYYFDNGKRVAYNQLPPQNCYKLTEQDTVVVSDSIYCDLAGHDTHEVLGLIWLDEKRHGRKSYLFMLGYCSECQKYYMDQTDYKKAASIGRLEVTIINKFEDSESVITSGEIFNLERDHLNGIKKDIDAERTYIQNQPDYVNRYETDSYDDGGLNWAKNESIRKYEPRLKQLADYRPRPYLYRVDISREEESETYYIGAIDVFLNGRKVVISANSELGHQLVNYQTQEIKKGGYLYGIKFSRQFDIEDAKLYGYRNIRTDEDIIFKKGVTDPFLVRVLTMRRQQHNLTDIFVTIQDNQNRIVNSSFDRNIIVQGCAGSGKTMVLLHRLSSLAYREQQFDFSERAMILTPNDQFNLHIKGIADELQIGSIPRISIEQYYRDKLAQYDPVLTQTGSLVSEMSVNQDYVDYIYSDQFKKDFDKAFDTVITERNSLVAELNKLTTAAGFPPRSIAVSDHTAVIRQIQYAVEDVADVVKRQDDLIANAEEDVKRVLSRKAFLEEKIPQYQQNAENILKEAGPKVKAKIEKYLSEQQDSASQLQGEIASLQKEQQETESRYRFFGINLNTRGKRTELERIARAIQDAEKQIAQLSQRQEAERPLLTQDINDYTDEVLINWIKQVSIIIPDAKAEVRMYENAISDYKLFVEEYSGIDQRLSEAQAQVTAALEGKYGEGVRSLISTLREKTSEYEGVGTFEKMFTAATAAFKEAHHINSNIGKNHRYDLYARLLFALKFYGNRASNISFMFVDEGQDLALNEYRLINTLNGGSLTINVFGDTNQLMKAGRGISDWADLTELFKAQQFTLNENYRNTNQITRFCNSSFDMNVLLTGVDGKAVREIPRNELEKELADLDIGREKIAILIPRDIKKEKFIRQEFLPVRIANLIGDRIDNGYISLMYVEEVKGIEFDKAYVLTNGMARNEKYIAYTRALSELVLVVAEA